MVSMKDIAKACGVSVATVSKALNDYSDIGRETRERVREMADEMGYFPNSSARALKTKRTFNLGVLFVDDANSGLTHEFFAHILESFKVTAMNAGYDITFTSNNIAGRKTSYLEHCKYRGVDGVVIACIDFYDPSVQELIMSDLPVVTIDHVFDNRIAVTSDNIQGMKDLVNYVVSKGHRKIAYIHGADSSVTRARLNSYFHTLASYGIDVPEEYVEHAAYLNVKEAVEATGRLLDLPERPSCILYPDDVTGIAGVNELHRRGFIVGKDISVCGYDGIEMGRMLKPAITTVAQDTEVIGRVAAQKLISLIEQPRLTMIERVVVPAHLIEGGSVADLTQ